MKASLKYTEILQNGNCTICYTPVTYSNTVLRFLIPLIISLGLLLVEFIYNTTAYSLVIIIPILIKVLLYWLESTEKENTDLVLYATKGFISQITEEAVKQLSPTAKEIRRSYEVIDDGKYGFIKEQYIRVALSTGKALRFDIVRDKTEDNLWVLEISSSYRIIE